MRNTQNIKMSISSMKLSRLVSSVGKKQMLPQLWHLWGSSASLGGLPPDDSTAVDDDPTPPPTSPILVLDGHSLMNALCWTKCHVMVAITTYVWKMFPPIGGCVTGGTCIHGEGRGPSMGLCLVCS